MSDYPMLISNKLHSFRNFWKQVTNGFGKRFIVSISAFKALASKYSSGSSFCASTCLNFPIRNVSCYSRLL